MAENALDRARRRELRQLVFAEIILSALDSWSPTSDEGSAVEIAAAAKTAEPNRTRRRRNVESNRRKHEEPAMRILFDPFADFVFLFAGLFDFDVETATFTIEPVERTR